jgi:hypothetical protein
MKQPNKIETIKEINVKESHKLIYQSPCLVEYGSVSKLTQGGGSAGGDGGSMQPK